MILAVDQYGQKYLLRGLHPRKELIEKIGARSAQKMYRENPDRHVGYIVQGQWLELFECRPWKPRRRRNE